MYEFKVDLNGDAIEDVTYRLTFKERDEDGKQSYIVRCMKGAAAPDPHEVGTIVAKGTTDDVVTTKSGLRVWAGRAGDPFWIEPDVPHAVGHAFQDGKVVDLIWLGSETRQEPLRRLHPAFDCFGSTRSGVARWRR